MKKVINSKLYNTETAEAVGNWSNKLWGSFDECSETLYRKRTGEFFLHGEGGARTKYAEAQGNNCWGSGEAITPLTWEAAQQWAEEHLDGGEYEAIFGQVAEDDSRKAIAVSLAVSTIDKAKQAAAQQGTSLSAWIESLILGAVR